MKNYVPMLILAALMCATTNLVRAAEEPKRPVPPPPPPRGELAKMSDAERADLEKKLDETWAKLPLESKTRAMRLYQAVRDLPPEERRFIHDRIERFLNMSPEERERLRQNRERWEQMTPEQRQEARERFQQRRREFEERWQREHPGEEPPPFPFRRHGPRPGSLGEEEPPPPPPPPNPAEPIE